MVSMRILPLAAVVGLAACSEGTDIGRTPFDVDADRFQALSREIVRRQPTDPRTLPTTGEVTYDGVLGFNTSIDNRDSRVLGDLQLRSDFQNDEVAGTAGDFYDDADRRIGGTLMINNGVIDRRASATTADPTFTASVRGDITTPRGADLEYRGTLDGNFFGGAGTYVGGNLDGTVDDGIVITGADGEFAARR